MVSLKDIAKTTGVSTRTVTRAFKDGEYVRADVRERVLLVARELGYRPDPIARSLSTGKSHEVAVVAMTYDELGITKLAALERTLQDHGYSMTITFDTLTGARGKAVLDDLLHRRPAGIIVLAHAGSDLTNVGSYFNTQEIPYLLLDPLEASSRNLDAILIDRQQGVYEAIHYLARQGRRRIAYLGQAHSVTRLAGYYRALAELGISPLLIELDDRDDEQFSAARDAARRFAELSPRPDAVQAYSDVMALGFIAGLHDLGIAVPDDVAVIGFDDRRMAEVSWPLLTTVAQPSREVGIQAGKILLKKIAGEIAPPEGWTQTLPTRLVVRESA